MANEERKRRKNQEIIDGGMKEEIRYRTSGLGRMDEAMSCCIGSCMGRKDGVMHEYGGGLVGKVLHGRIHDILVDFVE